MWKQDVCLKLNGMMLMNNAHEGHTTSAHRLIEQIVASMNADDQMSVINRINESIEHSRVGCSMINHLWKIYPKITEKMK